MKRLILLLLIGSAAFWEQTTNAQQLSPDVATILRASLSAQASQKSIQDVTISGTAEAIAGSDDDTNTFIFKAASSGASRTEIDLSSGKVTEVRQASSSGKVGTWSSTSDTVRHPIPGHNMMVDAAWWFPIFLVQRLLVDQTAVTTFVGMEDGLAHFQSFQMAQSGWSQAANSVNQRLTKIDLYLDAKTFLPARLCFNIHPDENALLDIPVTIQFSNYQVIGGAVVPMHITKYVNNTLALDARVQSVTFNTGLSQAEFAAQ